MSAAAAELATPADAPAFPLYMAHLVDRAAQLLKARWKGTCVDFTWVADGEEWPYIARLEWPWDSEHFRIIVFDRHGEFVCQSLPGELWTVDPTEVNTDCSAADDDGRARLREQSN